MNIDRERQRERDKEGYSKLLRDEFQEANKVKIERKAERMK